MCVPPVFYPDSVLWKGCPRRWHNRMDYGFGLSGLACPYSQYGVTNLSGRNRLLHDAGAALLGSTVSAPCGPHLRWST